MNSLFRLFQPSDFDQLYAIEELCFQPPLRFSRAYMRRLTGSSRFATWIAEEDSRLTGFAIVDLKASADPPAAYIQTIEVRPASRHQGIANELLRLVETSARDAGARSIWLHVETENKAAIRLYEAHDYMRKGREEHFYARHRAAFIYGKSLSDSTSAANPAL
jgi:ribosomal protein S18 acetylase RimI-like enzyme